VADLGWLMSALVRSPVFVSLVTSTVRLTAWVLLVFVANVVSRDRQLILSDMTLEASSNVAQSPDCV